MLKIKRNVCKNEPDQNVPYLFCFNRWPFFYFSVQSKNDSFCIIYHSHIAAWSLIFWKTVFTWIKWTVFVNLFLAFKNFPVYLYLYISCMFYSFFAVLLPSPTISVFDYLSQISTSPTKKGWEMMVGTACWYLQARVRSIHEKEMGLRNIPAREAGVKCGFVKTLKVWHIFVESQTGFPDFLMLSQTHESVRQPGKPAGLAALQFLGLGFPGLRTVHVAGLPWSW